MLSGGDDELKNKRIDCPGHKVSSIVKAPLSNNMQKKKTNPRKHAELLRCVGGWCMRPSAPESLPVTQQVSRRTAKSHARVVDKVTLSKTAFVTREWVLDGICGCLADLPTALHLSPRVTYDMSEAKRMKRFQRPTLHHEP